MTLHRTCLFLLAVLSAAALAEGRMISGLGRIEPAGGVVRLSGPSALGSVLVELNVKEGDWIDKGQVIAMLDSYALRRADMARVEIELQKAQQQLKREQQLASTSATSQVKLEVAQLDVKSFQAALEAAKANLELALVRAPFRGQVLDVHTHPGEQIRVEGILELGRTDRMYVIAEVYETDIARVAVGQTAQVRSPALAKPVSGKVESIGMKVGRMDVLGTDPVAETDARVIEVSILLDDPAAVSRLTNLQVEVEIDG
jgi:HlyD family secretion protein